MRWIEEIAIISIVSIVFAALVWYATGVPQVQISNTTQKCVKVVPASAGTCENLPAKYERVWVK